MTRFKGALLPAVALLLLVAAPVSAQIVGHPIEISGGAGLFSPDGRSRMMDRTGSTGALGWRYSSGLTFEGQGSFGPSRQDTFPNLRHNFTYLGLDLRWNLRHAENPAVPFVLIGGGYGKSHTFAKPAVLERGAGSLGLGLLYSLYSQRSYVRIQVRDVFFRERQALEFSHHWFVTAGLQINFGGKPRDSDLDGVRDWLDRCPETPIGAKVDARGCPSDADGDSVFDGIDKCPDTPKGCKVDRNGCSSDADGDGVCDQLDHCPNTVKGCTVDANGSAGDADGDSVCDGVDKCPDTPKGCAVDENGCPRDDDGDGVCDGLDQCPNTPAGLRVDARGCPIEVSEKETQLLDTGTIRLQNVNFETRKAVIKPESFALLDEVAMILQQYPTLRIEIGGHTDNRGTAALNDTLSRSRARSVMEYIHMKFPTIDMSRFTAQGYGLSRPIAPNTSELGRAMNRRVEFRVINTEALRIERERRRFLRKDEGAPADSTRH